jgi:hypothetical protein
MIGVGLLKFQKNVVAVSSVGAAIPAAGHTEAIDGKPGAALPALFSQLADAVGQMVQYGV